MNDLIGITHNYKRSLACAVIFKSVRDPKMKMFDRYQGHGWEHRIQGLPSRLHQLLVVSWTSTKPLCLSVS